jgi:hypothetical protein
MTVTVKYVYKVDGDREVVNFTDWVSTLSAEEQAEFNAANRSRGRTIAFKTETGALKVEYTPEMTYIWDSAESADAGLGIDPIWEKYQNRYLTENNIKLEITKE